MQPRVPDHSTIGKSLKYIDSILEPSIVFNCAFFESTSSDYIDRRCFVDLPRYLGQQWAIEQTVNSQELIRALCSAYEG